MGRLIVVSNRVATPTGTTESAGGLAVGVFGALKETGGVWFGWSGDVVSETVANAGPMLDEEGPVTFATVGLTRKDYDQYYRGFRTRRCGRSSTTATTSRATSATNTPAIGA